MARNAESETAQPLRLATIYFALVVVLTAPLWIADSFFSHRVLPEVSVAGLAVVVPLVSACLIAKYAPGQPGVRALLWSLAHPGRRMSRSAGLAVALPFSVAALSWSLAEELSFSGLSVMAALIPVLILAAIAEELGWSAVASAQLAWRYGPLATGLAVGLV